MSKTSKVVRLSPIEQQIIENIRMADKQTLYQELIKLFSSPYLRDSQDFPTLKQIYFATHEPPTITLDLLIQQGFMTEETADYLIKCLSLSKNILILGGVGTGKTTLLQVLLDSVLKSRPDQRTIVLERYSELKISKVDSGNKPDCQIKNNLSIEDLSSINKTPLSNLIIGEITSLDNILSLAFGLKAGSRILATMHGSDWKTDIRARIQGNFKDYVEETLINQPFVIVKLSKRNRSIEEVYEDFIERHDEGAVA
ncbi:ATPase, T2SS/T4P/T4SS family [Brevibacillus sp. NPDC058079]|uniref:ATPase, T2SS/T4P/T4SS family n=1 Tax=Brevibacillus sp. NPDC058079 TaxID=3346330 RepID=UPI0036F08BC5